MHVATSIASSAIANQTVGKTLLSASEHLIPAMSATDYAFLSASVHVRIENHLCTCGSLCIRPLYVASLDSFFTLLHIGTSCPQGHFDHASGLL